MAVTIPVLPRLRFDTSQDVRVWANDLVDALEKALRDIASPVGRVTVSGLAAEARALDCSGGASLQDVTDVLGTVVKDLERAGVLVR
jgi:hypothetical protein